MTAGNLIGKLGGRLGVGALEPNEAGEVVLTFDGMPVSIVCTDADERVLLSADLGAVPDHGAAFFMRQMLQSNHLLAATCGATLSIDKDGGQFCLCRSESLAALDMDRFLRILESFVNRVAEWREVLAGAEDIGSRIEARQLELEDLDHRLGNGEFVRV